MLRNHEKHHTETLNLLPRKLKLSYASPAWFPKGLTNRHPASRGTTWFCANHQQPRSNRHNTFRHHKSIRLCIYAKLISKLRAILGEGPSTAWITSFLSQRLQYAVYDQAPSNTVTVTSGVPQGSVLGPLLFLIFVNDITCNVDCNIKLIADDCIIYQEIKGPKDHDILNRSLEKISELCNIWQMSNIKKKKKL